MIAMKREVAAARKYITGCRFSVERKSCKLTTSHCTKQLSIIRIETTCESFAIDRRMLMCSSFFTGH